MKSFRTELENSVVEKDILDLEKKIFQFKSGILDEDSFRSLRLARGVYGQRQQGVQMIRIKLPLGIVSPDQLRRIAEISDTYSDGLMHITTRQDIQVHHVSLDDTPQLWADLEKDQITLREACGNSVRNITASPYAGVDSDEPFDVTDYGWTLFQFFLRNPIAEEMGRKFKIAFSSSEKDLARTYMHDLGLIPVNENGLKGFKVLLGGGLGAQPAHAFAVKEFLPVEQLVSYAEAVVRFFDQYGERNKRHKARFKFLIKELGIDVVTEEIEEEFRRLISNDTTFVHKPIYENIPVGSDSEMIAKPGFSNWLKTNVKNQRQEGKITVVVKIRNGNLTSSDARNLSDIVERYSPEEARLTIEQNLVIRSVANDSLIPLYNALYDLDFADFGAGTIRDITACPGTRTCNLGITASYDVGEVIEEVLTNEYPEVILSGDIQIKISGCMNSCGQHVVADIGFHGSSIRSKEGTIPALQVLLGGKVLGGGKAQFADKVIKIPTKRVKNIIRFVLDDFQLNKHQDERYNEYYNRNGKLYFYDLLKPLSDITRVSDDEYLDWGAEDRFKKEIGIGECAGVKIDLVKTLLYEAYLKIEQAEYFIEQNKFGDSTYSAYSSIVQSAKAFLIRKGGNENPIAIGSKIQIVASFEEYYPLVQSRFLAESFKELITEINTSKRDHKSAIKYRAIAERFHLAINELNYEK